MKTPARLASATGAKGSHPHRSTPAVTLDELLNRTSISAIVEPLGGPRPVRGRCAAWYRGGDNPGAVSLDDARGLWRDHGSGRGGGVLALVELALGCSRREAVAWLARHHGVSLAQTDPATARRPAPERREPEADDRERIEAALTIWRAARPLAGTLGETYLRGRGLRAEELEHAVRFHAGCPWGGGERVPAVVSLLRDVVTDEPCGVHRIGLDVAGSKLGKKMLGRARGAAVKLSPDDAVTMGLGVAEGVETALAILRTGWAPIWAALSAGGIERFPVLDGIEALTIFADADPVGLAAARCCAKRWSEAGIEAAVRTPRAVGKDHNDLGGRDD